MKTRTILILTANAENKEFLRVETEAKEIRKAIQGTKYRDQFAVVHCPSVTAADIREQLTKHEPAIVHFSGHGATDGLLVQTDAGSATKLDPNALADLFSIFKSNVQCVFLNACYSDPQAKEINRHIPYVIGMTDKIKDNAAILFSKVFYQSLGDAEEMPYEKAFSLAMNAARHQAYDLADLDAICHILQKSRIISPTKGAIIPRKQNTVSGFAASQDVHGQLYVTTEHNHLYWPSTKLSVGGDGAWTGTINVGIRRPTATICLISVDETVAEYIEYYQTHADKLRWCGVKLSYLQLLDRIEVQVDLMPEREQLVGKYRVVTDEPTGEVVEISLLGEWAVKMVSTKDAKIVWTSIIMIDTSDPTIGKGVYSYPNAKSGHHYIRFNRAQKRIVVDGYILDSERRWSKTYTLERIQQS